MKIAPSVPIAIHPLETASHHLLSSRIALSVPIAIHPLGQPSRQLNPAITQKMGEFNRSGQLYFYDHTTPLTEWLGNFYEIAVRFNGLMFKNSEAAFQAQKFIYYPQLMQQFTTISGDEAFHLAQNNSALIRSDWQQVKVPIMADVLRAKVKQHPQIAKWLLATESTYLIEHNPVKGRDAFWSDDCDGTGQNMLGKLWMQIRTSLKIAGVVF